MVLSIRPASKLIASGGLAYFFESGSVSECGLRQHPEPFCRNAGSASVVPLWFTSIAKNPGSFVPRRLSYRARERPEPQAANRCALAVPPRRQRRGALLVASFGEELTPHWL